MNIPCVLAAKHRPAPEKTTITDIVDDFQGATEAFVLDDMVNAGGTVEAVIKKLFSETGIEKIWLGVSHFLGSVQAQERLIELHENFGLEELLVTDSVPTTDKFINLEFVNIISLDEPLAKTVHCIHQNLPLTAVDI